MIQRKKEELYLISDDIYFSSGMSFFLEGCQVHCDTPESLMNDPVDALSGAKYGDIIILAVSDMYTRRVLSLLAGSFGMNVFFIFDIEYSNLNTGRHGYCSKKISKKGLLLTLQCYMKTRGRKVSQLTMTQQRVITFLAMGNGVDRIARKMQVSAKTIYSHKVTAMKSLKFSNINALGVLLTEQLMHYQKSH